jgi:hypothetical protein
VCKFGLKPAGQSNCAGIKKMHRRKQKMATKTRAVKSPSKVMETLSNAASMFQVANMNALATDTGIPVDGNFLMRNANNTSSDKRGIKISRPVPSTIMCPW